MKLLKGSAFTVEEKKWLEDREKKRELPIGKSFILIKRKKGETDLCLEIKYDDKTNCTITLRRKNAWKFVASGYTKLQAKNAGPIERRGRMYYKEGKNTFFGLNNPASTPSPIRSREALFCILNATVEGITC